VANAMPATGGSVAISPEMQPLMAKLEAAKSPLERAEILTEIAKLTRGDDQQPWLKQIVDAFATAAESNPGSANTPMKQLLQWTDVINKQAPGTPAASYADYRIINTEYMLRMSAAKTNDIPDVQKWYREQLDGFLTKHSKAEEAPDALMRLAFAHELNGRDGEVASKTTYDKLARAFPNHLYAERATGAIRRLESEGKPFQLPPAKTLDGKDFNAAGLAGKPTVVLYWANLDPRSEQRVIGELKALQELAKSYADKLNIVTVSLDQDANQAIRTIRAAELVGFHLHAPGGLAGSPLAVYYGIQIFPQVFVVDKSGKMANRSAQIGPSLRDEIEKLLK
jgi:Thioredoxin-like